MHPNPHRSSSAVRPAKGPARSARWVWRAGLGMIALGIGLEVWMSGIGSGIRDRRLANCDGTILMPASGFVLAWGGVLCGLAGLVAVVLTFIQREDSASAGLWRQLLIGGVTALAVLALLFDLLFLRGAYDYAAPIRQLCSG